MSEREWYFYLDDMIRFSEQVLSYTTGFEQKDFEKDEKTYDNAPRSEIVGVAPSQPLVLGCIG